MTDAGDLDRQQQANRRGARWLMFGYVAFFAWLGFGGDFVVHEMTRDAGAGHYHHVFPWFTIGMAVLSVAVVGYVWGAGPQRVLWATRARILGEPVTPAEKQLAEVVTEMAVAAGLPRPAIYIVSDSDPNAFSTGWTEKSAAIAVTEGLLRLCARDELRAVIGHELGHIKNLDVRLMTLLAALFGAAALVDDASLRYLDELDQQDRASGFPFGRNHRGGLVMMFWITSLTTFLFAPIVTRLLALVVSREREFAADAIGAELTGNPGALADVLAKIEGEGAPTRSLKRGLAHMCIADPLGRPVNGRRGFVADLFGTHPPMADRIDRLRDLAQTTSAASGSNVVR